VSSSSAGSSFADFFPRVYLPATLFPPTFSYTTYLFLDSDATLHARRCLSETSSTAFLLNTAGFLRSFSGFVDRWLHLN